jgi:hypothetical protein
LHKSVTINVILRKYLRSLIKLPKLLYVSNSENITIARVHEISILLSCIFFPQDRFDRQSPSCIYESMRPFPLCIYEFVRPFPSAHWSLRPLPSCIYESGRQSPSCIYESMRPFPSCHETISIMHL